MSWVVEYIVNCLHDNIVVLLDVIKEQTKELRGTQRQITRDRTALERQEKQMVRFSTHTHTHTHTHWVVVVLTHVRADMAISHSDTQKDLMPRLCG